MDNGYQFNLTYFKINDFVLCILCHFEVRRNY